MIVRIILSTLVLLMSIPFYVAVWVFGYLQGFKKQ
mgnify:CR=1 FL=1